MGVDPAEKGAAKTSPVDAGQASAPADAAGIRHPHLTAALLALTISAVVLLCGLAYARHLENRYVRDLSKLKLPTKSRSAALHEAAVRRQDTLLLYGSSELTIPNPLRATEFFRKSSRGGFQVFPIGRIGTSPLIMLEDIAAISSALRGKRVVVSISPTWFYAMSWRPAFYEGNFSALGAYALAFSRDLSPALRRRAAEQMLRYQRTYRSDPVLKLSLEALAGRTPWSHALFAIIWPLGHLEELVLRLQDHWNMVRQIQGKLPLPNESDEELTFRAPSAEPDARELASDLRHASEWENLELVVEALKEVGARPLLLSMPIAGAFFDRLGIPREQRHQLYYRRLEQLARRYNVPLVDFEAEDEDAAFLQGVGAHLSQEGWRFYDDALDRFYHGALD